MPNVRIRVLVERTPNEVVIEKDIHVSGRADASELKSLKDHAVDAVERAFIAAFVGEPDNG